MLSHATTLPQLIGLSIPVLYDSSCRDMNKCLLTTDMEPMTDQSKDTTKIQLGESMSLIVVTYSNMSEGCLQVQKQLKDSCYNHQIPPLNE